MRGSHPTETGRGAAGAEDKANEILLSIFRDLNHDDSVNETLPLANRLGKQLDVAAAQLEGEATADPVGVAQMQSDLGWSMNGLGLPQAGDRPVDHGAGTKTARSVGRTRHPTTMSRLALAYQSGGEFDRAVTLAEKYLVLGDEEYSGLGERETILRDRPTRIDALQTCRPL